MRSLTELKSTVQRALRMIARVADLTEILKQEIAQVCAREKK